MMTNETFVLSLRNIIKFTFMSNNNICHILARVNSEKMDCCLASVVKQMQDAGIANGTEQSNGTTGMDCTQCAGVTSILEQVLPTTETACSQDAEIADGTEQTAEGAVVMADGSTAGNTTQTSEGIYHNGVFYPYNTTAVIDNSKQGGRDIWGQICYLQNAMDAFSTYSEEMTECIMEKINSLQGLWEKMCKTKRYTVELRTKYQWGLSSDTHNLPEERPATSTKRQGFRVVAKDVETVDIRSLQNKLMEERLLAAVADDGPKDPLLAILGAKGHTGRPITPMVWQGRINQLHYLIDTLYNENVIRCAEDNKWCVAAPLFIYSKTGKPFNSKQLTKASKINNDDMEAVERCIPANFYRK